MFLGKKPIITVLAALVLSLLLTACSGLEYGLRFKDGDVPGGGEREGQVLAGRNAKKFGASYMTLNNPYFVILDGEIKKVLTEKGDKLMTLDPQLDINRQINCIGELVAQQVELIFLNPVEWKGIRPALEAAQKAGTPVIVVDSPVFDESMVASTIISDNYNAGVVAAKHLMKKLPGGNVVILDHPTAKSAVDRAKGFEDTLAGSGNYRIAAKNTANGQLEYAMPVMEDAMVQCKKIDAVFAINDPSAIGAIAALEAAGKLKGTLVYGVDGAPEARQLIALGKMTATSAQLPRKIGTAAAETAYRLLAGEKVEKTITIPIELIDKDNVEEYPVQW